MIAEKLPPRVTELFIRDRKLILCVIFITQSYFRVSKNIRLNTTHYYIKTIPNKRELQQIAINHSSDAEFDKFRRTQKKILKNLSPLWLQILCHCVKSVQIRSFFWPVFSRIRNEYGEILRISPYSVRMWENTGQEKLHIWTLFTQCTLRQLPSISKKSNTINI